jgi:inositol transport system permease protein
MTGAVIGAVILDILTSGFTFLSVDAHYQEIIKGGVIVAAVVADQYRRRATRPRVSCAAMIPRSRPCLMF